MSYIEFLGAPGVGKSTIFSQLIHSDEFFGGVDDDAIRRAFLEKAGRKYRIPYRLTPSVINRFFEKAFIEYRFRYRALEDFIREYPDYISLLSYSMKAVSHEPEKIFPLCRRSAERYQIGISTVQHGEILCLDEGFAQRAFTVLWRCPDAEFSLDKYFNTVPIPDLLVHVDAPSNVCLDRQRERRDLVVAKNWETSDLEQVQSKSRDLCSRIRDHLTNETSVVTIENTGAVETVVEKISSEVSTL